MKNVKLPIFFILVGIFSGTVRAQSSEVEASNWPSEVEVSNWRFSFIEDDMSKKTIKRLYIESTNSFFFDWPHDGEQKAILVLRKHPRWGQHVILSIQRGIFSCSSGAGCLVNVKFDEGKIAAYRAFNPASGEHTQIIIWDYDRFVSELKTAKKLYIEAMFYGEGTRVLEFDVAGLKF